VLTHPFLRRCTDPVTLLSNCYKLNTFTSRIDKQAQNYDPNPDKQNLYKGWALEIFAEFLCKSLALDKRVGISNYQVVDEAEDTGVDGYGIGIDGKPATVQVKYRPADYVLTANEDHLTNFTSASLMKYGVKPDSTNMLIITTGKELHYYTEQNMLLNKVRVLGREKLRVLVDNNIMFWDTFLKEWQKALS
jgi:hypothetical protein